MPNGPLAHIAIMVSDLDQAVADWTRILAVLDPDQLEQPIVRFDDFTSGDDTLRAATFANANGPEIQLFQPVGNGPLSRRLEKRGEGVHHLCFTSPDLRTTVRALVDNDVKVTTERLWQDSDPDLSWQWWTFVSPETSHGPLLEIAHPYKAVEGRWEPVEGIVPVHPTAEEAANP